MGFKSRQHSSKRVFAGTTGLLVISSITPAFPHTASTLPVAPQMPAVAHGHNLSSVLPAAHRFFAPANTSTLQLPQLTTQTGSLSASLPGQGLDLDLASSVANIILGTNLFQGSATTHGAGAAATITVGGTKETFTAGQSVTAAEYVALQQVTSGQGQSIVLNGQGAADGGSFSLNQVENHSLSGLVIPANVTATDNFAKNQTLAAGSELLNYGDIVGLSTSKQITAGSITAQDIVNEAGGIITTNLPSGLQATVHGADAKVDLTLSATDNITNAGTISSTGALTLTAAQGSISNAPMVATTSPSSLSQSGVGASLSTQPGAATTFPGSPQPTISAAGNINLSAGSGMFTNAGHITSTAGNIDINAPSTSTNITINAAGGQFSAVNGDINVRNPLYSGSANIDMQGGNYLSNNLNLYTGSGDIEANVGIVSGNLNSSAGVEHILASTKTLILDNNSVAGDPTFANVGGDIDIEGANTFGSDVAILAAGNIIGESNGSIVDHGNNVIMVAGAQITVSPGSGGDNGSPVTLTGQTTPGGPLAAGQTATVTFVGTATGGSINFSNGFAATAIDTSSTATSGSGGSVTLAAYAGTTSGTGSIQLSPFESPSGAINTFGTGSGNGGTINIFAGQNTSGQITLGAINSGGGPNGGTGGAVNIATAQPTGTGGNQVIFNASGDITSGGPIISSGTISPNATVTFYNINTSPNGQSVASGSGVNGASAGAVSIHAGSSITADFDFSSAITAFGGGGSGGQAGTAGGTGGSGAPVSIISDNGTIVIGGQINVSGGGGGGGGGGIPSGGIGGLGGAGGSAGTVIIQANGTGLLELGGSSFPAPIYAVSGGAGGNGGNSISSNPGGGGGGGGSYGGGGGGGGDQANSGGGGGGGFFGGGGGSQLGGGGGGATGGAADTGSNNPTAGSSGQGGNGGLGAAGGALGAGGAGASLSVSQAGLNGSAAPLTSGGGTISIQANSFSQLYGLIIGSNVSLAATGSGSSITMSDNITGISSVSLSTNSGSLFQSSTGLAPTPYLITTPSLTIAAGSSGGAQLSTQVSSLTVSSANGVAISNVGAITLNGTSNLTANSTFQVSTAADSNGNGGITVAGNITAATGTLQEIILNSTENSSIGGTGGISQKSGVLTAQSVVLTENGDGTTSLGNGNFGSMASPISTQASTLTVTTGGNVYLTNKGSVQLDAQLGSTSALTAATTPDSNGNGQITVTQILAATPTRAVASVVLNSSESGGTGGIAGGVIYANNITLMDGNGTGTGNIGTPGLPVTLSGGALSVNTTGGVNLSSASSVQLGASSAGAGQAFNLNTSGSTNNAQIILNGNVTAGSIALQSSAFNGFQGGIIYSSGTLTALTSINLSTGAGSIGATSAPVLTATTGQLTISSAANAYVSNTGAVTLSASSATNLSLTSTGAITSGGNTQTTQLLALSTPQLNVPSGNTLSGAQVLISAPAGANLIVNNQGTLQSTNGNLEIVATPAAGASGPIGGSVNISGGGTLSDTSGAINITAATLGSSTNIVEFSGNQTLATGAILNAFGPNQAVTVDNGVTVTWSNVLLVNTPTLNENNGAASFNPTVPSPEFMMNTPAGGGTIADNSGSPLVISGSMGFSGEDLAIISAGNITDNFKSAQINMNNGFGNGGNLTLIAGYNFSPNGTGSPDQQLYSSFSAASGSISLSSTSINTSSSSLAGGNVLLVANGTIMTGTITTNGGSDSHAGNVTIIGTGIALGGAISATAGTALANGNISLSSASPQISGNLQVQSGDIISGSFTAGTASGGIISSAVSTPMIAGQSILLVSATGIGASQALTTSASSITASSAGAIKITNVNIGSTANITANTTVGGVTLVNTGSVTLGASSAAAGSAFSLTANQDGSGNGTITIAGNLTATTLTLTSNGLATNPGIVDAFGTLTATNVNLSGLGTVGTPSAPLVTVTSNLSASSTSQVYVSNTGPVTVGTSSTPTFSLTTTPNGSGNGQITIAGNIGTSISGGQVSLISSESGAGSGGIVESSTTPGTLTALTIYLGDSGSGNFGTSTAPIQIQTPTAAQPGTTGSVYLQNTGSISIPASILLTAGQTFSLTTTPDTNGNGQVTISAPVTVAQGTIIIASSESGSGTGGIVSGNVNDILTASTVSLSDSGTGNVGSSVNNVIVNSAVISSSGGGTAYITDNATAVTLGPSSGNNLNLVALTSLTVPGSRTFSGVVTFESNFFTVSAGATVTGAAVGVINTTDVTNAGNIVATTGNVGIFNATDTIGISGGGSLTATSGMVNIIAAGDSLDFTGNQTFNGVANLVVSPATQSVNISTGVTVAGNSTVNVYSSILNLEGTGTITGKPLNMISSLGSGTIANSSGSINLSSLGPLIFHGENLAIIASGSITDSGTPTPIVIDLSTSTSLQGGNLTLIAGFNFTPSASPTYPPNSSTTYTITGPSAGGSISLPNTEIKTTGLYYGGNVLAIANGSVTLGQITATGFQVSSGNVTIIGQNVTLGGNILSGTEGANGNVVITAATPQTVGTVSISNGSIISGSFQAGAPTTGAIISTQTGNVVGFITANSVTLTSGSGGIGSTFGGGLLISAPVFNASSTGTGNVIIGDQDNNALIATATVTAGGNLTLQFAQGAILNSSSSGGTFSVNANGSVLLAGNLTAGGALSISSNSFNSGGGILNSVPTPFLLTAPSISLDSFETVGTSANPILTATGSLTFTSSGTGAYISNNSGSLTLVSGSATNTTITTTGSFQNNSFIDTSSGTLSVTAASFTNNQEVFAKNIVINGIAGSPLTVTTVQNLAASNGNITINGPVGSDVTINNNASLTAEAVNITSTPDAAGAGGNLFIGGNGAISGSTSGVAFTAASMGNAGNKIEFSGTQALTGTAYLNAVGPQQQIAVDSGAKVTGTATLYENATNLTINGSITASPVVFNPVNPLGFGTISSTSLSGINLTGLGSLTFTGGNLTILSAGSITDTGSPVTINLSNPNGPGGSLTLIAGYNFSVSGQSGKMPDPTGVYTLNSANANSNITLGSTTINTTGAAGGGNVLAVATGSILLDSVSTNGGIGTSGNITLIGQGVSINNALDAHGTVLQLAGNVSISAATPVVNGTVALQAGQVTGGSFSAGAASGAITSSSNITANTITLSAGSAGIATSGSPLATVANQLAINSLGSAFVSNTGSVELLASTVTNILSLSTVHDANGNGQIVIGGAVQSTTPGTGTIELTSNETSSSTALGGMQPGAGGLLTAAIVNLTDSGGTTGFGFSTGSIQTSAGTLTANTAGSVFINNTGSVILGPSSAGGNNSQISFNLTTTPDANGNGAITVAGNVQAASGVIDAINLTSSENTAIGGSQGGMAWTGGILNAQTVVLSDGPAGTGAGNIGSAGAPIQTQGNELQALTNGSVFMNNTGALDLNDSRAGNGATFQLTTTALAGAGSIETGAVFAQSGTIGTITLNSTETTGTGGIRNFGALIANEVALVDGTGGNGNGTIQASTLTSNLTTSSTGTVTVDNFGPVTLLASSAGSLNVTTTPDQNGNGTITIAGNVKAATVTLISSENSAIAGSQGGIQCLNTGILTSTTVNLFDSSASGLAGSGNGNFGSAANPIQTNSATTLTVEIETGGNLFLTNLSSATYNLNELSVSNATLTLPGTVTGGVNVSGALIFNTNTLNTNGFTVGSLAVNGLAGSDLTVNVSGTVVVNGAAGNITFNGATGNNVLITNDDGITSDNGSINVISTPSSGGAGGNISISGFSNWSATKGALDITANTQTGADNTVTYASFSAGSGEVNLTTGGGGVAGTSGTITAGTLNLIAGAQGVIGTVQANVNNASFSTSGAVNLTNTGTLTINGPSTAGALTLTAPSINSNGNLSATGAITLSTSSLTVNGSNTFQGQSVAISSPAGQNLVIANAGTVTATTGNVSITSTPSLSTGGNVSIAGGGTINATNPGAAITINALTQDNTYNNGVTFTGSQVLNGVTNVFALGTNQFMQVNSGVTVSGNSALMTLYSPNFTEVGSITKPFVWNAQAGAGTLGNSSGNINLSSIDGGTLTFIGSSLAILASGSIIDGGNPVTINLSSASGNGGNLTLIAGFNFAPSLSPTGTPTAGTYTLGTANGGSITLGDTTINTGATDTGTKVAGGSVMAVADGTLTVDNITTSSSGTLSSGGVLLIGNGVTVNGTVTTQHGSGGTGSDGNLVIESGTAQISSGPVSIQNGFLANGSFSVSSPQGNISLATVNAGSGTVSLTTGGTGTTSASATISANTLILTNGSGGTAGAINTTVNNVSFNSTGSINLINSSALTINGPSTAATLSITAPAISTSGSTTASGAVTFSTGALTINNTDSIQGSGITVNGTSGQNLTVTLTASGGTLTAAGGDLDINGSAGNSVTISNAGTISAATGNVNIISTPQSNAGGNINIGGGGTIAATTGGSLLTINAVQQNSTYINGITFTGNQALNGVTSLIALGGSQFVQVDSNGTNGFVLSGNLSPMSIFTPTLTVNGTAQITKPFTWYSLSGAGTLGNNTGNIDLSTIDGGNFDFVGSSLAILASGNITDSNTAVTINLSGTSSSGGALTLIAGFNFSPALSPTGVPNPLAFTLTTAGTGNIMLGDTTITTGTTLAGGAGGSLLAVATGTLTLDSVNTSGGTKGSGAVNLIGNGITVNGTIDTQATGGSGGTVTVVSGVPQTSTSPVVITAGVVTNGAFSINSPAANISLATVNAGNGTVSLTSGGSGTTGASGTISANTLNLTNGSGGTSGTINTTVNNVSFNSSGSVTLSNSGALTFNGPGTAAALSITAPSISTNGSITASAAVTLSTGTLTINNSDTIQGSAITVDATSGQALDVVLTGASGQLTATTGNLTINGSSGNNVNLNNTGTISATQGNVTVNSTPSLSTGGNVNISGNGTIAVTNASAVVTVNALTQDNTYNNGITFTGSQTLNGLTLLNATGGQQFVTVNGGITVSGNSSELIINTTNFNMAGSITKPFIWNSASGVGTLGNSAGNIDLSQINGGNLDFTGSSLTILASGSITDSGKPVTIDLASSNLGGGNLTLIAGYDFSPALNTGTSSTPNPGAFTIGAPASGNISLADTTIETNTTAAASKGGSLLAVANGTITLETITTSGGTAGGSINLIGNSATIIGAVDTHATTGTGGALTISTGTPDINVGPVSIANGVLVSGSFNTSVSSGNISLAGVNAGSGAVTLTTGGAGNISASATVTAASFVATTGSGSIGTAGAGLIPINSASLTASTSGTVFISDSAASVTINGTNNGSTFSVTAPTGNLTVSAAAAALLAGQVQTLNLSAPTGTLTLTGSNAVVAADAVTGNGGSLTLNASTIAWNGGTSNTNLALVANGTGTGNGGAVNLDINSNSTTIFGSNPGQIFASATGVNGGSVNLTTAGTLSLLTNAGDIPVTTLSVGPTGVSGNGGAIALSANSIEWGASGTGNTTALNLISNGVGTGNGGSVSVTLTGAQANPAVIGNGTDNFNLQATGASGGTASFSTTGTLQIITNGNNAPQNISVAPSSANGGSIYLTAGVLNWGTSGTGNTTPLSLNADGAAGGLAGFLSVNQTGNTALNVGTTAGDLTFSAQGGNNNLLPNGSGVAVQSGGALVVLPSAIMITPTANKEGENVTLASSSPTLFNFGLDSVKNTNGVLGTISVEGTTANGDLALLNLGGALTNSVAITAVNDLTMTAGGAGSVTVGQNLGSATTNSITLSDAVGGTGSIISSKTIICGTLNLYSDGGSVGGASALKFAANTVNVSAPKGVINLSDTTLNKTGLATLNVGAFPQQSSPGGAVLIPAQQEIKAGGAVTLTTATSINLETSINASTTNAKVSTNIALKSTGTATGTGITLDGSVNATTPLLTAGTVLISAAGSTGISQTVTDDISGVKSVTLTATKGNISEGSIGQTTEPATVSVTGINVSTAGIKATTTISEKGSGTTGTSGAVTLTSGDIVATSTTSKGVVNGIVTITGGPGGIDAQSGTDISGGKSVTLSTAKGSIEIASTGKTSATGAVKLTALNAITDTDGTLEGTAVTLSQTSKTGPGITLNSMDATNGAISVIAAGQQLNVVDTLAPANITTAGSSKTVAATILLEDSNTATGSTSKIVIGSGTAGDQGVTIKSNAAAGGKGTVNIVMGAAPGKAVAGTRPAGMNASQINGTVFFGASATNTITTPFNPTNIFLNGNNANLVFNTGKLPASAITVNAGGTAATETQITADPPALVNPLHISDPISSFSDAFNAPASNSPTEAGYSGYTGVSLPNSPLSISGPITTAAVNASPAVLSGNLLYPDNINRPGFLSSTQETTDSAGQSAKTLMSSWISSTEIYTGEVPTIVSSDDDLGITTDVSQVVELKELSQPAVHSAMADATESLSRLASAHLTGKATFNKAIAGRTMSLNRGSVLFAPGQATTIETPFGKVHLSQSTLALVIAVRNGVAIYDLDDSHNGSVTIEAGNSQIKLRPGEHALITGSATRSLADLNPTQAIGFRYIREREMGAGIKAFTSEFDSAQAIRVIMPLKQLLGSTSPGARKFASHLLKTTAIMMQMGTAKAPYQQIQQVPIAAWQH